MDGLAVSEHRAQSQCPHSRTHSLTQSDVVVLLLLLPTSVGASTFDVARCVTVLSLCGCVVSIFDDVVCVCVCRSGVDASPSLLVLWVVRCVHGDCGWVTFRGVGVARELCLWLHRCSC